MLKVPAYYTSYFIGAVLDISRKATVLHGLPRGLRYNASDFRLTDAAGVKPPSRTLAPVCRGMPRAGSHECVVRLLAKIVNALFILKT